MVNIPIVSFNSDITLKFMLVVVGNIKLLFSTLRILPNGIVFMKRLNN